MGGDYNNKLGGAYCIYNNNIVLAHLALVIPDGLANGTLLATFPNGVNLKTSLGIGVSSATGAISTNNAYIQLEVCIQEIIFLIWYSSVLKKNYARFNTRLIR